MKTSNCITKVLFICIVIVATRTAVAAGARAEGQWFELKDNTPFRVPVGERQLFLDDYGIASIHCLARTMHQPAKKGAVIRSDPAKSGSIQIRSAPFWVSEEKVFKLLVADTSGPRSVYRWYESADGLHWTAGQKPNWGELAVVYDAQDPDPARRYKAMETDTWHGMSWHEECTGGFYVSPDGIDWTQIKSPGFPSQDEHNISFDERGHTFLLTTKCRGPNGRSHSLGTSKDFENWTNHGLIFHADGMDQELGRERIKTYLADPTRVGSVPEHEADYTVDVYNFGLFRYEGLYVGLPSMHHHITRRPPPPWDDSLFHLVQLTCSRDLKSWKRLGGRRPWLDISRLDSGAYDSGSILPPSAPIVRGPGCLDGADKLSKDQLWFYYTACKAEPAPDSFAICLAILRRDGFVSLDAGRKVGTIITMGFTVPGEKLFVNVDASRKVSAAMSGYGGESVEVIKNVKPTSKSELRVDVLGKSGEVLATSVPIKGDDHSRIEVKWQKGNIADLKGKLVSLRFKLNNARFYSYWLE